MTKKTHKGTKKKYIFQIFLSIFINKLSTLAMSYGKHENPHHFESVELHGLFVVVSYWFVLLRSKVINVFDIS